MRRIAVAIAGPSSNVRRLLLKLKILFGTTILLLLSLSGVARADAISTVTLDFDHMTPGEYFYDDFEEDGFRVSVLDHYDVVEVTSTYPTHSFHIDTHSFRTPTARFERIGGETFGFVAADLKWNIGDHDIDPAPFAQAFVRSSSGGVFEILDEGRRVYEFSGPLWRNLSWIEISISNPLVTRQDNLRIDDVVFAVPEPPAAILLTVGLLSVAAIVVLRGSSSTARRSGTPR